MKRCVQVLALSVCTSLDTFGVNDTCMHLAMAMCWVSRNSLINAAMFEEASVG